MAGNQMFNVVPYESVGPLRFGMSQDETVSILGKPQRISKNYFGESEHEYGAFALRFSKLNQTLVEVGCAPAQPVGVNGLNVFSSPTAFADLVQMDGEPFEDLGFILLMNLGITLTGFHDNDSSQKAATAFDKGRWDNRRSKFKPYVS